VDAQIRADRIDILVDLAGHTAGNRLGVFARRPAPIQVSYIGYPNTTGLARMDYRITDARADPPSAGDGHYTERLYRLPRCFLAYQPPAESPSVAERPMLAAGPTTFGSFNALPKLSPHALAAWAAILAAVPDARLVLKSAPFADDATRARYRDIFAAHDIAVARVDLLPNIPDRGGHLALYNLVDIALDTFPFNGTTTTCEALWMGVPVIALNGDRHVARTGASLLGAVGLGDLVANSVTDYVALARELAGQPQRVAAVSRSLRERMQGSPLCDARGLARALEAAFRDMWQRWCASAP
jgi:protein O-GlcNAc transferase